MSKNENLTIDSVPTDTTIVESNAWDIIPLEDYLEGRWEYAVCYTYIDDTYGDCRTTRRIIWDSTEEPTLYHKDSLIFTANNFSFAVGIKNDASSGPLDEIQRKSYSYTSVSLSNDEKENYNNQRLYYMTQGVHSYGIDENTLQCGEDVALYDTDNNLWKYTQFKRISADTLIWRGYKHATYRTYDFRQYVSYQEFCFVRIR